jgi:hypothetical protein
VVEEEDLSVFESNQRERIDTLFSDRESQSCLKNDQRKEWTTFVGVLKMMLRSLKGMMNRELLL